MFKKIITIAALALVVVSCQDSNNSLNADILQQSDVKNGDLIVTVGDTEIHQGYLDKLSELSPRLKAKIDNPLTKSKIVENIVDQRLLYQEAVKRGLDKDPVVLTKLMIHRQNIIANALLEQELESAMKKEYEKRIDKQFSRIPISIIAVNFMKKDDIKKGKKPSEKDKQKALQKIKSIQAKLKKGEDFAKLAKEYSDDKRTSSKGGAAGAVAKDDKRMSRMGLKAVTNKAFDLKKGETSGPIETKHAYYLVKVTDEPQVTSFEDAKRVLGFQLQNQVKAKVMRTVKSSAKVVYAKGFEPKQATQNKNQMTPFLKNMQKQLKMKKNDDHGKKKKHVH